MPSDAAELLLHTARLRSVGFVELSASRAQRGLAPAASGELRIAPQYALHIDSSENTADGFALTLRLTIGTALGEASVAAIAHYDLPPGAPYQPPAVITEFANASGVPTLLPFIRAELADLTARVFGAPILMPVMQPGELVFPAPEG